jgi:chromosome segregation ATPase
MFRQINLSVSEENPTEVPEEIQRMGTEAVHILWQSSQDLAKKEIEAIRKRYQQFESDVLKQRQEALNKVEQVNLKIAAANAHIETLTRENKSLQVDLNRNRGDLKNAQHEKSLLIEKLAEQEHEIKSLIQEVGRAREQADALKKRLYEVNHQAEQDRLTLKETREEAIVNLRTRERLDKDLKTAIQESKDIWEKLKMEQRKAAVAESLVQELREAGKKYEADIKLLKQEKHELKESLEGESKAHMEMEKKVAALTARADSQEWGYRETILKLENELEVTKSESAALRNRMIKAEGALEREKKALERLETKLIAATGAKML